MLRPAPRENLPVPTVFDHTLNHGSDAEFYLRSLLETRDRSVRQPVYFSEKDVFSRDENGELYADVEKLINALPVEAGNSQPVDRGNSQPVDSQESDRVW
ncbi:MAG: hypothetical protein EBE86_024220 [Hormoscilla sp. GUM202]|nr:hypothetical protein [Hormoscilla sp. GUM202]